MQKVVDVFVKDIKGEHSHQAQSDPRKRFDNWEKLATGSHSTVYKVYIHTFLFFAC